MANISFKEVLLSAGFDQQNAFKQQLILDSLIAEKIKLKKRAELTESELDEVIKEDVCSTYTNYIEDITSDLGLSKQLLVKEKLNSYLQTLE